MSGPASALDIATSLVCGFEGFRAAPYQDTAGVWTIGYGSIRIDGAPVIHNTPPITEATARALMQAELAPICVTVAQHAPSDATPNQIAACASFSYNEGIRAFLGSTLLADWLDGEPGTAAGQFGEWIYDHNPVTHQLVEVPGLRSRRERERAVFLGGAVLPPAAALKRTS